MSPPCGRREKVRLVDLLTFSQNPLAGNKDPNQNLEDPLVPQCVPKIPTGNIV